MSSGSPKIPLPMIALTTKPVRLQRPIARTSPAGARASLTARRGYHVSFLVSVSHIPRQEDRDEKPQKYRSEEPQKYQSEKPQKYHSEKLQKYQSEKPPKYRSQKPQKDTPYGR